MDIIDWQKARIIILLALKSNY